MRAHTITAMFAVAILPLAVSCSGSSDQSADDAKQTSASSPAPSVSPTDTGLLELGATRQWKDAVPGEVEITGSVTALAYKQPITGITAPTQKGEEWGQLEAKVCITSGTDVTVSQFPWSLAFPDDTRVKVTGDTGGDLPRPEYPMDAPVKAGDCARGLIEFPVPKGVRPERVIYAPEEGDSAEWAIPK